MLTDPGQIQKVQGALDKIADATEKLCAVRNDEDAHLADRVFIHNVINDLCASKLILSTVIPPDPIPP